MTRSKVHLKYSAGVRVYLVTQAVDTGNCICMWKEASRTDNKHKEKWASWVNTQSSSWETDINQPPTLDIQTPSLPFCDNSQMYIIFCKNDINKLVVERKTQTQPCNYETHSTYDTSIWGLVFQAKNKWLLSVLGAEVKVCGKINM